MKNFLIIIIPIFCLFSHAQNLKTVFTDSFTKNWQKNWFLDGTQAKVESTANGLLFCAGTTAASDSAHAVLWTKRIFSGNLRIEFDFTKRDAETKFVNIIYLYAEGSGAGVYKKDIFKWKNLRRVPAMKIYYNHIRAFHISFSAFENDNSDAEKDYIRARLYRPESGRGLDGTEILPEYLQTGLFAKDKTYHICIERTDSEIAMSVSSEGKVLKTKWILPDGNNLKSGRIGLRVMGGRVSEFANFRVLQK